MPYATGRTFNDADAHIMEPAGWLAQYADPAIRGRLRDLELGVAGRLADAAYNGKYDDRHWREVRIEENLMQIKGWEALGAFDPAERTRALDLLGFSRQLVFMSLAMSQFWGVYAQREHDLELIYGGARAVNRGIADFCHHDQRLLPVGFLPLDDAARARLELDEGLRLGCRAFWIPSMPAGTKSPTHPDFDPIWARLQEADTPFVLHVGTGAHPMPAAYRNNARGPRAGFAGGGESLDSKDFMMLHAPAEAFLSAMVLDGTLEEFPRLRGAAIELGALWVPSWMRRLDLAQEIFARNEPALALPLKASDYVRRQLRFTPFPTEPVGWIMRQTGDELLLFSSDYPHIEGGRNPIKRFEESLTGVSETAKERFYANNFAQLMGVAG
ncbi:MAG TPA: amidohydrolase family protein [Candidatus Binataceae bacterium]|nr:amidohydrolase family protein [Candidatus Binataceae bacterium]